MKDSEIFEKAKKYFDIEELVSPTVHRKYGEKAWQFIDIRLLHCLVVIRRGIGKPMIINNWRNGGSFSQRGLRSNLSQIFRRYFQRRKLYLSAHTMGKAADFHIPGMHATEVRKWIVQNGDKLPCKVRLERNLKGKPITWVHIDVFWYEGNGKVYLFDV